MIINKDPSPLPTDTDENLTKLVNLMLEKDLDKRPTIWDIIELDFMKEHI